MAGRLGAALAAAGLAVGFAGAASAADRNFAIIYAQSKNDGGYNEAAYNGVQQARQDFDISVRESVVRSKDKRATMMKRYAGRGIDHVIAIGFQSRAAVAEAAKANPDTHFTLIDASVDRSNVRSVLFKEDQAGYLAGVAAGHASDTGHVGFIGGMPIPPVKEYGCGFVQGVRSEQPEAKISWSYIGDSAAGFRNSSKAAELAQQQLQAGADVIFPAAGFAGQGALKTVAEQDALGIGVDINQNHLHPGAVLTSAVKRVDRAVYLSVRAAVQGNWSAGTQELGASSGGVGWAVDKHNKDLVKGFRADVQAAQKALANGEIEVRPPGKVAACR